MIACPDSYCGDHRTDENCTVSMTYVQVQLNKRVHNGMNFLVGYRHDEHSFRKKFQFRFNIKAMSGIFRIDFHSLPVNRADSISLAH